MAESRWDVQDHDRELFERELDDFLPHRIFDAHAHLYAKKHFQGKVPGAIETGPDSVGLSAYLEAMSELTPGRRYSGLFFGFPHAQLDMETANTFLAEEVRADASSRGQMLIRPGMDPEYIRETVRREKFAGLKCYHVWATEKPTFEARVESFLPEEHVRVAHEEGLSITLHMVRARAMADPLNQQTIRTFAERYPNMRFILAHAARGFNPHHTIEGIGALRGLRNVWCDTSAVTDGGAFEAIIETLGHDRLLYGSDFCVSHERGRCVAIGDSFLWLSEANTNFHVNYADLRPALVGLESLRVLKTACRTMRLSDSQIEDIFWGSAAQLYGLD
jgi:glutamate-1-semialdehyde 2,1-aminomutase